VIDCAKLDSYLAGHLDRYSGPSKAEAFAGGQSNPTYKITTPSESYVLRRKPDGELLKSAHAVDREFRVQKALLNTEVPVAEVLHHCANPEIVGTEFYIMRFMEGRIFRDPALLGASPSERADVYGEMARVLAAIHDVELNKVGLSDFGRPEGYYERQLKRWTQQYRASETEVISQMDALIEWLSVNIPEDDGQFALTHGDYRIDNLLFDPDRLVVRAVFDWELSTLGHPLADLAYQVMQRSMGRDWHIQGLAGLDTNTLGIPSEEAYVDAYCAHRGIDAVRNWSFAKAFCFFRFAAICQGVGKRALDGNNANPTAPRVGAMARPLAELGFELIS